MFDIEDTFGIEIPYNANEEVQAFATVGSVVDRVKGIISETKASRRGRLICRSARASWALTISGVTVTRHDTF